MLCIFQAPTPTTRDKNIGSLYSIYRFSGIGENKIGDFGLIPRCTTFVWVSIVCSNSFESSYDVHIYEREPGADSSLV